ncbi:MAG: hypothetical protein ACXVZX_14450 [Terriglobales bacterium]
MLKSLWSVLILAFSFACLGQTCEHIGPSNFQTVRVDFVGADSVDPASIRAMIANLEKDILEECQFKEELQERIRDQFQRFGYFKVDVHNDITYRQLSATADLRKVSVRVMVDPGRQYRLDHLAFTGGTVFSADELRALVPMKDGDIFDVERMREGSRICGTSTSQRDISTSHRCPIQKSMIKEIESQLRSIWMKANSFESAGSS